MIYFNNDYSEGCHPMVMQRLIESNMIQTIGYGEDDFCRSAGNRIRKICGDENLSVHFLVGGTQTNLTVIDAALRPHQGVIGPISAHINTHETGAVEATGHKVLWIPSKDGKITGQQIEEYVQAHWQDGSHEHLVQPKMVYISNPTELGTIYTKAELESISRVCREKNLLLFADGARLGYGLTADGNDITMADMARCCDVFYIGGTKVGALFGEAVVISNPAIAEDFRYLIKQHGGMLAKGRLLGVQFDTLMKDNLYLKISRYANLLANDIRAVLKECGYPLLVENSTNQIFPIIPDAILEKLEEKYVFCEQERIDGQHRAVRICTSWATTEENVIKLGEDIRKLTSKI